MKYKVLLDKLVENKFINPSKDNKISTWIDRKISDELRNEVMEATSFLSSDVTLADRVSTMQLGIVSKPICKICGSDTRYHRSLKNYSEFCSSKCQVSDQEKVAKRKSTLMERYGVDHNFKLIPKELNIERGKRLYKQGKEWLASQGVSNAMDLPGVRAKHQESTSSKEYIEQRFKTIDERYGSYSTLQDIKNQKMKVGRYREYDMDDLLKYRSAVYSYTRLNDLASLEGWEKRGRLDLKPDAYHLEHKYSVLQGFKNNISPSIIGSRYNLEMVCGRQNIKKSDDCSITIGELLSLFEAESYNTIEEFKQVSCF